MTAEDLDRGHLAAHLDRILTSSPFRQAERSAGLLRYLVERALDGAGDRLKEYTVGIEALGRSTSYDPRTDPIVRAEASRLRARLEQYYAGDGQHDAVVIELPKGTYTPQFRSRPEVPLAPSGEVRARRDVLWPVRAPLLIGFATTLAFGAAFGLIVGRSRTTPEANEPISRLEVQLQTDGRIATNVGTAVVISPDGSRAVFVSLDSLGVEHLRVRRFDGSAPLNLPGTDGARGPFWSPDGRWIGFWSERHVRKISVDGGAPVVLCESSDLLGASWSADGTIIAALDQTHRLWRIDATSGGTPVATIDLSADRVTPLWPQVLDGGKAVLYTAISGPSVDQANIEVVSMRDGRRRVLVKGGTFGRYVGPHHLTYVNQGTLFAVRFDPSTLETRGQPIPILDDVAYSSTFGFADFSVSETGLAIYRRASPNASVVVARVDSAGHQTLLLDTPAQYAWPSLSPDGSRLALTVVESGVTGLSLFTNLRARPQRAWNVPGYVAAAWSRDGEFLVASGTHGLAAISAVTGVPAPLLASTKISVPWTFAPGDSRIAYSQMDPASAFDLYTASLERHGDSLRAGAPSPLLRTPSFETYPTISPDGRWVAYASNVAGPSAVYVRAFADSSHSVLVAQGARIPRWSRTGARLFVSTADQRIMVVDYATTSGRFVTSAPKLWAPIRLADTGVLPNFDVAVDDRYIVALLPVGARDAQSPNHVTLVRGLSVDLERRVP